MILDESKIEKITEFVKERMYIILEENMTNIENLEEIEKLYKGKNQSRDEIISKISNGIITKIMEGLPQKYVSVMFENIQIDTKSKDPNIKFDIDYEIDPIKPYVDFIVKINGIETKRKRISFEVNSNGVITENEIKLSSGVKTIQLGTLEANIKLSLTKVLLISLSKPIKLFEKTFTVDLSKAFTK